MAIVQTHSAWIVDAIVRPTAIVLPIWRIRELFTSQAQRHGPPRLRLRFSSILSGLGPIMSHPELPYVAFFAAFLVLVTLPWHWRAKNVATLAMVAWLFVINVIYGVDAIIWR